MKVTMLYFYTIAKLIEEYGFSWEDVDAIQDNENRVKFGGNCEFSSSLEDMFMCAHMSSEWESYLWKQNIIDAFVAAIHESRAGKGLNEMEKLPFVRETALDLFETDKAALLKFDLQGADLRGADLTGADLHGAILHGAILHGANLRGADLMGAIVAEDIQEVKKNG